MIPVCYMAKRNLKKPEAFAYSMPQVTDIYSISSCVNDDFADYFQYWKHNNHWFFDSTALILQLCAEHSIRLEGASLFFYEAYPQEYDEDESVWRPFEPNQPLKTNVVPPENKHLEGFNVVSYWAGNAPEHSPLSCNGLGEELNVNSHCLLPTLEAAKHALDSGAFSHAEPGPFRIFAVYSVDWQPKNE